MKKQLTIILISSVIAMILCGCSQSGSELGASKSESVQSSGSTQTSQSTSSGNETSADSQASDGVSENEDSKTESKSSKTENSEKQESKSSSDKKEQSSQNEEVSVIHDEDGNVTSTPSKYVSNTQMTVDLSDSVMAKTGEDLRLAFITSKKELDDYYTANKDKYALDKPDSGNDFKTAVKDLTDEFFSTNNVMIIVQSYDKGKNVEIGDTHIEDKGAVIDIYKETPRAPDKAAYVMNLICYSKNDISKMPEVNVLAAGGLYSDESDPDVIVYLDDDEEDTDAEDGPLYIIDENDNVTVVQPQGSNAG